MIIGHHILDWAREEIEEDPTGAFYDTLAKHYGVPWGYCGDPRVILYMKIQHVAGQKL